MFLLASFMHAINNLTNSLSDFSAARNKSLKRYAVLVGSLIEPPLAEFTRGERAV